MQEINLYHLVKFYVSKWMTVLIVTVVGIVIGFIYSTFIQTPMYKSNATLILISSTDQSTSDTTLINNYLELFKSRRVLEPVIANNNLNLSYDDLINSTDATNAKNTAVINVTISTKDSFVSKSLVEGAIISFKSQVKELYGKDNVKVVDNASLETKPYNVNTTMQLVLSAVAGFIVSIIALFFVFDFSTSKTAKQTVETTNPSDAKTDDSKQGGDDKSKKKSYHPSDPARDEKRRAKTKQARAQWVRMLSSAKRRPKR